ncbi:hypothetical protein KQX54_010864 [Cotesia glomerata]|uniref:Immunoglobulin I-set domain-containing protein n=1 Tax=Cotesia glomerata TaxID=32391 RepID=A0AAV7HXJ4_COTGL|nr:hypothetical protein KQX54_010864 [Cotesia glomerata]
MPVTSGPRTRLLGPVLAIEAVTQSDSGVYQCIASNVGGETSAELSLAILLFAQYTHRDLDLSKTMRTFLFSILRIRLVVLSEKLDMVGICKRLNIRRFVNSLALPNKFFTIQFSLCLFKINYLGIYSAKIYHRIEYCERSPI